MCFKKVRVGGKRKESEVSQLISERAKLKLSLSKSSDNEKERLSSLIREKEE